MGGTQAKATIRGFHLDVSSVNALEAQLINSGFLSGILAENDSNHFREAAELSLAPETRRRLRAEIQEQENIVRAGFQAGNLDESRARHLLMLATALPVLGSHSGKVEKRLAALQQVAEMLQKHGSLPKPILLQGPSLTFGQYKPPEFPPSSTPASSDQARRIFRLLSPLAPAAAFRLWAPAPSSKNSVERVNMSSVGLVNASSQVEAAPLNSIFSFAGLWRSAENQSPSFISFDLPTPLTLAKIEIAFESLPKQIEIEIFSTASKSKVTSLGFSSPFIANVMVPEASRVVIHMSGFASSSRTHAIRHVFLYRHVASENHYLAVFHHLTSSLSAKQQQIDHFSALCAVALSSGSIVPLLHIARQLPTVPPAVFNHPRVKAFLNELLGTLDAWALKRSESLSLGHLGNITPDFDSGWYGLDSQRDILQKFESVPAKGENATASSVSPRAIAVH